VPAVAPSWLRDGFATAISSTTRHQCRLSRRFRADEHGAIIIAILSIDVKFRKNRHRLLASAYVDP